MCSGDTNSPITSHHPKVPLVDVVAGTHSRSIGSLLILSILISTFLLIVLFVVISLVARHVRLVFSDAACFVDLVFDSLLINSSMVISCLAGLVDVTSGMIVARRTRVVDASKRAALSVLGPSWEPGTITTLAGTTEMGASSRNG